MRLVKRYITVLSLLWVMIIGVSAAVYSPADVPSPKARGQACYVTNPDAILSDSDVVFLNYCAADLEKRTQVEMCVVALESIGQEDCFNFCYELFQRWGIGKAGRNTGVLICFVLDSHDIRMMTGSGIEGVLPDARCSQIIHDEMIPFFRNGLYGEGICCGALRVYEICTDGEAPEELATMQSVTNRGKYAQEDEMGQEEWIILIALLIFIAIIIWASMKGKKGGRSSGHGTPFGGGTIYMGGSSGGFGGGFSGGSWGGGSTSGGGAGARW